MRRLLVLATVLAFLALLAFFTILSITEHGLSFEAVVSILVLVVLGIGIVGALSTPRR